MSTSQYTNGKYFENHPTWDLEHAPFKARYVARMIELHGLKPKTVADVGCGNGGVLAELKQLLPEASMRGFDISPQAIAMGQRMYSDSVALSCENPLDMEDRYDLVLGMDVIEHVEDVFEFLRKLKSIADYKILHIPLEVNLRWVMSSGMYKNANASNGHIHFFNPEIAHAVLKWANYEIIDSILTPHAIELAHSSKARIAALPRKLLASISEPLANKLLGGWSLMVLAR